LTGPGSFMIDENSTGSAEALSAAVFRSSEGKIGAQDP